MNEGTGAVGCPGLQTLKSDPVLFMTYGIEFIIPLGGRY